MFCNSIDVLFTGPENLFIKLPESNAVVRIPKELHQNIFIHFAAHEGFDKRDGLHGSMWGMLHKYFCSNTRDSTESGWMIFVALLHAASNNTAHKVINAHICSMCARPAQNICTHCKPDKIYYCSRECQKKDWPIHKTKYDGKK